MKTIRFDETKNFQIETIQINGRFIDKDGNPIDSGGSTCTLQASEDMSLPESEIIEKLGE